MKNFFKLFGIIALVAVIGFSTTACDNGNGDSGGGGSSLNGTWLSGNKKLVINNTSYTLWYNNAPEEKGEFNTNNGSVTTRTTEVYFNNTWLNQAQAISTGNYTANDFLPYNGTYVLSNNNETLTISFWDTWIKSP